MEKTIYLFGKNGIAGKNRLIAVLFGVAALTVSVLSFTFAIARPMLLEYDAMHNWVRTQSTVLSHRIGTLRLSSGGKVRTTREVPNSEITYEYEFGGNRHVSSRVSLDRRQIIYSRKVVRGYQLICYVNPKNPAEATLNRSIKSPLPFLVFPGLLLIFAIAAFVAAAKNRSMTSIPAGTRPSGDRE